MKKAFTMLELVFVIVLIGIISVLAIPNLDNTNLRQAADQVVGHIRYTQHLAMMDDKFDANENDWYKKRWQIIFGTSAYTNNLPAYTIYSDTSKTGEPNISEMAINPLDGNKVLSGGYSNTLRTDDPNNRSTREMNLGEKYGINLYILNGGCTGARVSFDYLGRPIKGDLNTMTGPYSAATQRIISSTCNITLCQNNPCDDQNITIAIEPETGYTHILN